VCVCVTDVSTADFEREVVGDTSRDIERQVGDIIDWMIDKNSKIWR
jgi:hypothetical protein